MTVVQMAMSRTVRTHSVELPPMARSTRTAPMAKDWVEHFDFAGPVGAEVDAAGFGGGRGWR